MIQQPERYQRQDEEYLDADGVVRGSSIAAGRGGEGAQGGGAGAGGRDRFHHVVFYNISQIFSHVGNFKFPTDLATVEVSPKLWEISHRYCDH